MPIETKPLPAREDQPVSRPIRGSRACDATPDPVSRGRHDGIDQAKHNAVQEMATNAINAAVTYSIMSESISSLSYRQTNCDLGVWRLADV